MGSYMRAPKSRRGMSVLRKDCDSLPEKSQRLDEAMDCAVAEPAEAAFFENESTLIAAW
jgi:hypothetical protein